MTAVNQWSKALRGSWRQVNHEQRLEVRLFQRNEGLVTLTKHMNSSEQGQGW
jgi:hypothetical protein